MTSVESLLSEVSTILRSRLTIKAADEAFFGGKQVYTNIPILATSSVVSTGGSNEQKQKDVDNLRSAIQNAKDIVSNALAGQKPNGGLNDKVFAEIANLKKENMAIREELVQLRKLIEQMNICKEKAHCIIATSHDNAKEEEAAEDEDFDLFGSDDEEDEEKKKLVEERLKAYAEKKSKKPGPIAKSSVILDVKPWDDETNLEEMEKLVRSIEMDGLVWGGAKFIPIGYGIKKLQIICVIEDLKVSVDDLIEKITGDFESHVQSVDIVAFNKI